MTRLLSLLTITRNPDPLLFDRLVMAVESLSIPPGWDREWIIVIDGNVAELCDRPRMSAALARAPWIRVVPQGDAPRISGARAVSIEHAAGDVFVILDDDCVPASDYLLAAVRLLAEYPQVHCWGPGHVTLEWLGRSPPAWLDATWRRTFFQERALSETAWSNVHGWAECYASGVGMVILAGPAREYARRVRDGRYSAVNRTTARAVSGEDAQMLWTAILLGGAAGTSPALALRHAVRTNRLDLAHARSSTFGLSESALPCQVEVFGVGSNGLPSRIRALRECLGPILRGLLKLRSEEHEHGVLEVTAALATLSGVWRVRELPEPWWLRAAIGVLDVR